MEETTMKKKYFSPEIQIVKVRAQQLLTVSDPALSNDPYDGSEDIL